LIAFSDLHSAVVGVDGTFFVNDAVGTVYALRMSNGSLPSGPPTPVPSNTMPPPVITTSRPPGATASAPFSGAWLLVFVVGAALAAFGVATLVAMFLLRHRRRAGFEQLS
jgi:hypothetical protein